MKKRLLGMMVASVLLLTGCASGGPNDVALLSGHRVTSADVQHQVDAWADDPLYTALADIVDPALLAEQAKTQAQELVIRRHMVDFLLDRYGLEAPDEAAIDAEIETLTEDSGGLDALQEQTISFAKESGAVQGPLAVAVIRDQVRLQLGIKAVIEAISISDEELSAFLAANGIEAKDADEIIMQSAREQLASQTIQNDLAALDLQFNPRFVINEQNRILGQTADNPQASFPGGLGTQPSIQTIPAQEAAPEGESTEEAPAEAATPAPTPAK